MPLGLNSLYRRAAAWATAITAAGYATLVIPHVFWPPNGQFNLRSMMFGYMSMLLLAPGLIICSLIRGLAFVVMHPVAAYHFWHAIQPGEGVYYVVDMNPLHVTGLCSAATTWFFYLVILSRTLRKTPKASRP